MEKDDKRIEDLVNRLMAADNLEAAPSDFTDKVMSRIQNLSASRVTTYRPLIPKYIWWLIVTGFLALIAYFIFKQPSAGSSISERYNLPEISFSFLENISLGFSNTLVYALIFLAIMLSIQIPLLKQYFNNRLSY